MAKREEEWLDLIREVLELIVNDKVEAESIRSRIVFRIVLWEYDILQAWTAFMVLTFLTVLDYFVYPNSHQELQN